MKIEREVIVDLLTLYVSGEASAATRALVEEYIGHDPELAERVSELQSKDALALPAPAIPPELALRSLRRARALLALQRWLFGLGMFFTLVSLSFEMDIADRRIREFHFLIRDSPVLVGFLVVGICCWIVYFAIRQHLSSGLMRKVTKP